MQSLDTIHDYLRSHSEEIGNRILASYTALYGADEAPSPLLSRMVRVPYPAQTLAVMGVEQALAIGAQRQRRGRVRCRQDAHRFREHVGA